MQPWRLLVGQLGKVGNSRPLSNNVIEEVKMHFGEMVFNTIIQRNVRLSEATGFGESIIKYDASSKGAINYLNLAKEFVDKNELIQ